MLSTCSIHPLHGHTGGNYLLPLPPHVTGHKCTRSTTVFTNMYWMEQMDDRIVLQIKSHYDECVITLRWEYQKYLTLDRKKVLCDIHDRNTQGKHCTLLQTHHKHTIEYTGGGVVLTRQHMYMSHPMRSSSAIWRASAWATTSWMCLISWAGSFI